MLQHSVNKCVVSRSTVSDGVAERGEGELARPLHKSAAELCLSTYFKEQNENE